MFTYVSEKHITFILSAAVRSTPQEEATLLCLLVACFTYPWALKLHVVCSSETSLQLRRRYANAVLLAKFEPSETSRPTTVCAQWWEVFATAHAPYKAR